MGFQDALYKVRLPYASQEAVEFADRSMEAVSYYAIQASTDLAEERGRYQSFEGSLWSQGILPIDSLARLAEQRGTYLQVDDSSTLDWDSLRERVTTVGMRNSNTMAMPRPRPSRTSAASASRSNRPTRTCSSNRTCLASSPWSTRTWCATSRHSDCGIR